MSFRVCKNCGYVYGLHCADTNQCPQGGEAPLGRKQKWLDTTWDPAPIPDPRTGMDAPDEVDKRPSVAELRAKRADITQEMIQCSSWWGGYSQALLDVLRGNLETTEDATADTEANGYPLTEARLEIDRLRAALNEANRQRDLEHKRFTAAERNEAQMAAALALLATPPRNASGKSEVGR